MKNFIGHDPQNGIRILAGILLAIAISIQCKSKTPSNYTDAHVIRTDFSSDISWKKLCKKIIAKETRFHFQANVEFINNPNFANQSANDLKHRITADSSYGRYFFFITDSISIHDPEHPILCVSIHPRDTIDRFRVFPKDMWIIENNLSTANLLFSEMLFSVDEDGFYRSD